MRRLPRLAPLLVVVAALCSAPTLPAQPSLVVRGRVVRADDPATPLSRARLSLNGGGRSGDRVFTDAQGRFEIEVPAANATLTVLKPGFVTATLTLPRGRPIAPLDIQLVKGAAVNGRVIDPSGQLVPLSGVRVRPLDQISPANPAQSPVSGVTDDRGEFRVGGLPPGRYEVSASFVYDPKEQFESDISPSALLVVGVPRPTPEPVIVSLRTGEEAFVTLNHRETAGTVDWAGDGAVTGVVIDEFGEAVQGLRVRLWQTSVVDGRRLLAPLETSSHATDDRGQYRSYNVPHGKYLVAIDDPDGVISEPKLSADTPVFYPRGALKPAEAIEIELGPQEEAAGIDVVFRAQRHTQVRGFVENAAGRPYSANVTLVAASHPGEPLMPERYAVSDESTGAFQFENVIPGEYVVRADDWATARSRRTSDPLSFLMMKPGISEFGATKVRVGSDAPAPVNIKTGPTSTIVGNVVFEGILARPDSLQFTVMAVPDDPDTATGVKQATVRIASPGSSKQTFEIAGVVGPVRLVVNAPVPWWVKSVQGLIPRSPDDVLDPVATAGGQGDLTMVLAATAASVSGRVRSDGSRRDNMVILFSTEERRWFNRSPYIRTSESGANTRFTLAGIPPGEYFITAVDLDGRQRGGEWWTEREALLALALTARRITLSEGQSGKVDLPIVTAHR